jgi:hypothetical protein
MVERENIQVGTRIKLLIERNGVAAGTPAQVETIRAENWGTAWAFSVQWDDHRKKNRYSLFFTEADLAYFELVSASADRPVIGRIRPARFSSFQLMLPFTEVALYRGTEVIDTFEMLID